MTVLLDLDGVLCDFVTGLCKRLGIPVERVFDPPRPRPLPYRLDRLLGVGDPGLGDLDASFWAGLEPYPWARELVAYLEAAFGENVLLCTSVGYLDSRSRYLSEAVKGKERWICANFPQFSRRTAMCFGKDLLASPDHMLLDDNEETVRRFAIRGGVGLLFPRPWNSLHEHADDPLKYLKTVIEQGKPSWEKTPDPVRISA